MITPTIILALSYIKARYDSRPTFFWKYRSLSVHLSQRVNALCHRHFDNNLVFTRPRYEGIVSCKNLSHPVWHLNSKCNPSLSFVPTVFKCDVLFYYVWRKRGLSSDCSRVIQLAPPFLLCELLLGATPGSLSLPCNDAVMEHGGWATRSMVACLPFPHDGRCECLRLYWPVGDNLLVLQGRKYFLTGC